MWLSLQAKQPADYVIASGENHTVGEFVEEAFSYAGLDWKKHVESDPKFVRAVDIAELRGDASKARRILGWKPEVDFKGLVRMMVDADCEREGVKRPSKTP
jgi:GDPmannose 4,6-dehydratase